MIPAPHQTNKKRKMKITTKNISRYEVVNDENNSNDGRVILAELCGDFEGVLLQDNAGWSITLDPFETVVGNIRAGEEINGPLSSTTVEGIRFREDYSAGWIVENSED